MRVVNLGNKVGDGQLQAIGNKAQGFVFRCKSKFRSKIKQNIGDVRYDEIAIFQERRRKGNVRRGLALKQLHHRCHAIRLACDIDIVCSGLFKRKPDEFAAALQFHPNNKVRRAWSISRFQLFPQPNMEMWQHSPYEGEGRVISSAPLRGRKR